MSEQMIQANSSASEKVCDHPSTEKAEWLLLPRALTAENGAKAALIGEFSEKYEVCADQFAKVPVSWTTIKAIWKAAVAHFEAAPPDGQMIAHPANSLRGQPESDSLYYELMALYNASRERERELTAEVERLRVQAEPSLLGRETVREALEYIEMAENRLECVGCPECVEVARSYLKEAARSLKE